MLAGDFRTCMKTIFPLDLFSLHFTGTLFLLYVYTMYKSSKYITIKSVYYENLDLLVRQNYT